MLHKVQRISASALCSYTLVSLKIQAISAVDTYFRKRAQRSLQATVLHKVKWILASAHR